MESIDDIQKLKKIFDESIYSIVKYGFGKRNILVVVNEVDIDYLIKIKPYLLKLKKTKNILVIPRKNIKTDNLGVDFLNIKLTSAVIYGADIFKELKFDNTKIKRQIHYESNKTLVSLVNEILSRRWQ
jgi:hypothetical protein